MENKSCYNCRYFHQHYIIHLTGIRPLECGHCGERKIKANELSKFPFKNGCELWEENKKTDIKERKERFKKKLNRISKEIHEIALILKIDERNNAEQRLIEELKKGEQANTENGLISLDESKEKFDRK